MKVINIITIFPEAVKKFTDTGILQQAGKKEKAAYNIVDLRDFSEDKHKKVDDKPYGGGPGMVISVSPVVKALENIENPGIKILLSPRGKEFNQKEAGKLVEENFTLICARYTGIDERIMNHADCLYSTGNYIVSGGELPALIITEAVVRLIPGVLGDSKSLEEDKGYPVYTRPRDFRGYPVPEILLSGNHEKIEEYRRQEARHGENNR